MSGKADRPPNCADRSCGRCFRCHLAGIQFGKGAVPRRSKQGIRPVQQPTGSAAAPAMDRRPGGYGVPYLDASGIPLRANDPRVSDRALSDARARAEAQAAPK